MKHISVISRVPVVAETEVANESLQLFIDVVSFLFELVGAFETAFTAVLNASLSLKETLQA